MFGDGDFIVVTGFFWVGASSRGETRGSAGISLTALSPISGARVGVRSSTSYAFMISSSARHRPSLPIISTASAALSLTNFSAFAIRGLRERQLFSVRGVYADPSPRPVTKELLFNQDGSARSFGSTSSAINVR